VDTVTQSDVCSRRKCYLAGVLCIQQLSQHLSSRELAVGVCVILQERTLRKQCIGHWMWIQHCLLM